jgi:hypothetical protein
VADRFFGVQRDYRGLLVCNSCWDNRHWHRTHGSKAITIVDCEGGACECPCRGVLADITRRNRDPEPDHSQQLVLLDIDNLTVEHRDDN